MQMIKKTSLEETADVKDTLEWKLKTIQESGMPTETALADYFALAIENLEQKLEYVKYSKSVFTAEEKAIKEQMGLIKGEGAKFLQSVGMDKLEGVRCSSVTLTTEKQANTTTEEKTVFKALISDEEIQELLIGLGKGEMVTVTETKTSSYIPSKLKINKKRSNVPKSS